MAFLEGSKMRIKTATKEVLHELDATLTESRDFEEIASKDIVGKNFTPGESNWSLSSNAWADNTPGAAKDLKAIADDFENKALVAVTFTDGVSGNIIFSGSAYIENYSVKAAHGTTVTFDYNLKGVGPLVKGTNL